MYRVLCVLCVLCTVVVGGQKSRYFGESVCTRRTHTTMREIYVHTTVGKCTVLCVREVHTGQSVLLCVRDEP